MKTFNLYKHSILGVEAVKEGFTWPGFFFPWIWAFMKKLWLHGAIILPIFTLSNVFAMSAAANGGGNWLGNLLILILALAPAAVVGFYGNSWRRKSMAKRGYELLGMVEAESADGALAQIDNVKSLGLESRPKKNPNRLKATIGKYFGCESPSKSARMLAGSIVFLSMLLLGGLILISLQLPWWSVFIFIALLLYASKFLVDNIMRSIANTIEINAWICLVLGIVSFSKWFIFKEDYTPHSSDMLLILILFFPFILSKTIIFCINGYGKLSTS